MNQAITMRSLILLAALVLAAAPVDAGGRCYTAEIPETMVLPDGSKHEPGTLRLCMERTISPVSMLHRGDVAGRPIGMFASAPREIETTVEEGSAHFFFQRNGDEDLALIGYAVWAGDRTTFFDMTGYAKAHEMAAIYEGPDAVVLIAGWGQGRKRR